MGRWKSNAPTLLAFSSPDTRLQAQQDFGCTERNDVSQLLGEDISIRVYMYAKWLPLVLWELLGLGGLLS